MLQCLGEETMAMLNEEIPMGRPGEAEEIAQAVMYLVNASYVTGHVLSVNGGMRL